jgi:hypothetical protein
MNTETDAYKLGYLHGYEYGVENNPYDHDDLNRVDYKQGYDAGIHDFCIVDAGYKLDEEESE